MSNLVSSPFQSSVVRKYLAVMDGAACRAAFERFDAHFGDQEMRDEIRKLKEEEYQAGFMSHLFENVLGYTLRPLKGYDLKLEQKNVNDDRKADAAIIRAGEEIHAVIELKGTDTIDLNRVEAQAFGYKNAHADCHYVITSNFERLRFYVDDTTASLEWNLFNLPFQHATQPDFRTLYLVLAKAHLLSDMPLTLRRESTVVEEEVTKKLYKDYSAAKNKIFEHLQKRHPERDPLRLFQLTQKLLDRLLFVFFGEDKGLLPPNTASKPIGDFDKLRELDAGQPLYVLLNKYFGYIDQGVQRKDFDIPAYNGGLFAPDEELESLDLPDPVLRQHLLKLTAYKFDSEVDVNILGHIFEHSLNDIEEIQAELRGEPLDKSKTKRKKEGVFYTPRYITKYIVGNTVGRLCTEKKAELGIDEQDYARGRKGRRKTTVAALRQNLEQYRAWLLDLKICDPACGSGAFLNEALNFLIEEHNYVSELERQLFDAAIAFEPGPAILENNLYGVDINEEAVEIAKLSLWLRTAERGRKLADLSTKIKVGNSLIDDQDVAGDKAFVWAEEFPEVFGDGSRGGFDVVVGNPPYVDIKALPPDDVKAYFEAFETATNRVNLYAFFIEKGVKLVRSKGVMGYINPNSMLLGSSFRQLRALIIDGVYEIVKLPDNVFTEAVVETILLFLQPGQIHDTTTYAIYEASEVVIDIETHRLRTRSKRRWRDADGLEFNIYVSNDELGVIDKAFSTIRLIDDAAEFCLGLTPYDKYKGHSQETIKSRAFHSSIPLGSEWKPLISGAQILPYAVDTEPDEFIKYGPWLGAPRDPKFFAAQRVVVRQIISGDPPSIYAGLTSQEVYHSQVGFAIIPFDNSEVYKLTAILNSTLGNFLHTKVFLDPEKRAFQKILIANCKALPFPLSKDIDFRPSVEQNATYHEKLIELKKSFLRLLSRSLAVEKPTRKLEDWPSLTYKDFLKEVIKIRKKSKLPKLTLTENTEWEPHFHAEQAKVLELRKEIERLDREIDVAVYRLYGLTYEEVKVVDADFWMSEEKYNG